MKYHEPHVTTQGIGIKVISNFPLNYNSLSEHPFSCLLRRSSATRALFPKFQFAPGNDLTTQSTLTLHYIAGICCHDVYLERLGGLLRRKYVAQTRGVSTSRTIVCRCWLAAWRSALCGFTLIAFGNRLGSGSGDTDLEPQYRQQSSTFGRFPDIPLP